MTFHEMDRRSDRAARQLAGLGVGEGSRVALVLEGGVQFAVLTHALARLGAVMVPINTRLAPPEVAWCLQDVTPALVVCDASGAASVTGGARVVTVEELASVPEADAPTNVHWAIDNRTVSLRVPASDPSNLRVENRVAGADANPYLAMAMTLACGYLGMKNKIKPKPEMKGDAYLAPYSLPRSLGEALDWLRRETDLHEVLGKEFVTIYTEIKELEFEEFMKVISPWEREHLLLHV